MAVRRRVFLFGAVGAVGAGLAMLGAWQPRPAWRPSRIGFLATARSLGVIIPEHVLLQATTLIG